MTTDPKPVQPTGEPNVDALIDALVCPSCRTIYNAAKAKCADPWHYDNRAEPVTSTPAEPSERCGTRTSPARPARAPGSPACSTGPARPSRPSPTRSASPKGQTTVHDPDVVAFNIRRPWPKRTSTGLYWPSLITVWHSEPGGQDSGEVCKHYTRAQDAAGKWQTTILHGWRWHIHHWRIQIHPLQDLRRWALTRCAWCGGRSRKGDYVNTSHQWDGPRGRWWRGEPGLFHRDCSMIERAHATCLCTDPLTEHHGYGRCLTCGKYLAFGRTELRVAQTRVLAAVPHGQRDPAAYQQICDMSAASREASDAQ